MHTDSTINRIIDSILSIHTFNEPHHESSPDPWVSWIAVIVVFSPLIFTVVYWSNNHWKIRKWKKGVFPKDLTYSKTNLMEAYASLTVCFITFDRNHQMRKIAYLKSFFRQRFKHVPEKFDEIIDRNFHYPIEPVSIVKWINQHANEQRKKQLIQFLVGLSHIDNTLRQKEYDALKVITRHLQLDLSFLESTIFSYRGGKRESKATNERKSTHRTANTKPPVISGRRRYADILGVSENAGADEIKKRHRQLVKLYHPDKYARESKEKQEQAHQRFLEIQEAYEFLTDSATS